MLRHHTIPGSLRWLSAALLSTTLAEAQDARRESEADNPQRDEPSRAATQPRPAFDRSWRRPLASRNQFPVSLMFVSLLPEGAASLSEGSTRLDIGFDYSNIIIGREAEDEFVYLDLEYLRTVIAIQHGLPATMEVGVSIPLYLYYGGFLDGFVRGFHESLGLPNFLRGQTDNGVTRYELVTGASAPFLGDEAITAFGDITLHFKKTVFETHRYAFAARTNLKLPLGEPEQLSGSGATDIGFGLVFDRITDRWGLYSNANYHLLGQPETFRVTNFFSLMVGFDYRLRPKLTVNLQFDHAESFVESKLPLFNEAAQQIALGLRLRYSERFVYEWRFVEDLSNPAPDFTFSFQIGIHWNGNDTDS